MTVSSPQYFVGKILRSGWTLLGLLSIKPHALAVLRHLTPPMFFRH
ncbi:hypothetical protein [Pseudoalteromonas rubra]|nr:hypothetical protein [Pseudoalteromonas rubra]MEC4089885.1 hypothetical protein [Pseudoalteromonas rubra]